MFPSSSCVRGLYLVQDNVATMRQNLDSGLSDFEVLLLDNMHLLMAYFMCQKLVRICNKETNPCFRNSVHWRR